MFLYLLISLYRVKDKIGERSYLAHMSKTSLKTFLQKSKKTIVFFTDDLSKLEFAEFAIGEYKNQISFVVANFTDSKPYHCDKDPCIVPFHLAKHLNLPEAPIETGEFLNWIRYILNPEGISITSVEELRLLLEDTEQIILSVGKSSLPSTVPKNISVYFVQPELLSQLQLNLESGYYVYQPIERKLLLFDSWQDSLFKSSLVDPNFSELTQKQYFAGFVVNSTLDSISEKQIQIANQLSRKYSDQFYFTVSTPEKLNDPYLIDGKLQTLSTPFFFIFESNNISFNRWLIYNTVEQTINSDLIESLIDSVIKSTAPYTIISEEIPQEQENSQLQKIVRLNFDEKVISNSHSSFVLFSAPWCGHCQRMKVILNEISLLLNDPNLFFFNFDGSKNDHPSNAPQFTKYPTLMLWLKGQNGSPKLYDGNRTVQAILQFIESHMQLNVNISQEKIKEIEKRVSELTKSNKK